jgi:hypothetical protein
MNLKTQKLILYFLKRYDKEMKNNQEQNAFFEDFFNRKELLDIIDHKYGVECFKKTDTDNFSEKELISLVRFDFIFLSYLIEKIEANIGAFPTFLQTEINDFFTCIGLGIHYLASKRVETWDEYDRGNYHSLLRKHGKTKLVFALFDSGVKEKDKYSVTTPPSLFFDTKKEAEQGIEKYIKNKKLRKEDLKIMSLWKLTNN